MTDHIAGSGCKVSDIKVGDRLITDGEVNRSVVCLNRGYAVLLDGNGRSVEVRKKNLLDDGETTVYLSNDEIIALYNSIIA